MNRRILVFPVAALLSGCEQLTGVKPSTVPCHGYAPLDSVTTHVDGTADTTQILRLHVCGEYRKYATISDHKKAA